MGDLIVTDHKLTQKTSSSTKTLYSGIFPAQQITNIIRVLMIYQNLTLNLQKILHMLNATKKTYQILGSVSSGQKMSWAEWNHMNSERVVEIYQ